MRYQELIIHSYANNVIAECHEAWQKLIKGEVPGLTQGKAPYFLVGKKPHESKEFTISMYVESAEYRRFSLSSHKLTGAVPTASSKALRATLPPLPRSARMRNCLPHQ